MLIGIMNYWTLVAIIGETGVLFNIRNVYVYVYVCVCMCVCARVRARARARVCVR